LTAPRSQTEKLPAKWIDWLFAQLNSIYGYYWSSRHASHAEWEVTKHVWAKALADLTAPEIRAALTKCATTSKVPTLPEFRAMARPIPADAEHPQAYRAYIPEIVNKSSQEFAAAAILKLKIACRR
jgi:hypothetical protein